MGAVEGFLEAMGPGAHSFVLLRRGETVADGWWAPYERELPQLLFSLSKSFTSTAVGLAVADGLLSVEDRVVDLVGATTGDAGLASMRVRDLLTMTTGHAQDATDAMAADDDWVRGFLAVPVVHRPGTRFVYNSAATYMLSAILRRLTGERLVDYLRPRLFDPLGFGPATWEQCPRGVDVGGWGLSLHTADLARFGELCRRGGEWDGRQLVPAGWMAAATGFQVPNEGTNPSPDWQQGYGYQFWRCRHGAFRADGAFGQFVVVMPEQELVLAVTAATTDMQRILDAAWTHLLPAADFAPPSRPLTLPALGSTVEPAGGFAGRTFRGAERATPKRLPFHEQPTIIEALTVTRDGAGWLVDLEDEEGTHRFRCTAGVWHAATVSFVNGGAQPMASTGAWLGPDTFELRVCRTGTPFVRTYTAVFDGSGVAVRPVDNVGFTVTEHPVSRLNEPATVVP